MAGSEETIIVLADTSVLVNLAIVDRLDLLGALRGLHFQVPEEVIAEVLRERGLLERALREGHVAETRITGIAVIDHYRQLRHDLGLGRGEAACLALATTHGCLVACDEKRVFRREARRLLGEGRVMNTPGLFLLGIRQQYWTVPEADQAKETLERNRFRMNLRSFHDLVRRGEPSGEVR